MKAAPHATADPPQQLAAPRLGRDFALVFTGQAVSMQGDGLASLALLWWIAEQTGSVALATTLSMLSMLPVIFLGPVAGVVIDRYSRRQMMMIADILRAVFSGIVAWGSSPATCKCGY